MAVVVIYDSVLYRRTGLVGRWAHSLQTRFVANAKTAAPKRSGELAAGIHGETELSPSQKIAEIAIFSDAPHTRYVLGGTTGPIMSRRLWGFRARTGLAWPRGIGDSFDSRKVDLVAARKRGYALKVRAGKGYSQRYAAEVSGQKPNDFFAAAAEATARTNSSLRGFSPKFRY